MLVPMHNSPTAANGHLSLTVASSGLRKGKKTGCILYTHTSAHPFPVLNFHFLYEGNIS
ncbi:ALH_1b_G0052320.mRNA.1.CDS.1 [Saccharomyces cerevisiae]|nr:ALH_1c_G0051990.mRNA.1.CDS.1 [Saccharomyces cerevisiae]CAI4830350.1 CEL_1a_G0052070.mRNA.1.CDS.1 [Saccharomyces cerevisiae]CAI4834318.1 ALH_1b_G0052320.mRNA.1.CDS.1 [Saccharomyces cerevisiae]CAI5332037.1 AKR_HP2_G0049030.mRNA.1.CDS.1 [Saccharomyces cerevisiae]CAI5335052.1 CIH_HP2_G0050340.mRNA.1.CDS.1 [Saccharomyces cerevisiae]